ncbi:MAG: hypothetical protein JW816_00400, partial [Candidatus Buchananbacteria bacterium]|nr:hypothetical protein [Candidatus Buchananbacteria bacterium]
MGKLKLFSPDVGLARSSEGELEVPDSMIEQFEKQSKFLGKGMTAHVITFDRRFGESEVASDVLGDRYVEVALKVFDSNSKDILNWPTQEADIQQKAERRGVRTPKVFGIVENSSGQQAIAMERIRGYSLEDIVGENMIHSGQIKLPADFTWDGFWAEAELMIKRLHEKREDDSDIPAPIYHRDIKLGNLMIDLTNGRPVIIDFGLSGQVYTEEDDPYLYNPPYGPTRAFVQDEVGLTSAKNIFSNYLVGGQSI